MLFVSWDGEEQGLLGSTEWVEDLATELQAKAAVYVNRDAGAGGLNFSGSAVHSLTPFVHELAQSIQPRGRDQNAVRRLARAGARTVAGARRPADAEGAAGRRARIGIRLHRVPRSRRHRVDGHGAERPRRRRQLPLDLRQPDLVQEVHRSAVHLQRPRVAGDRRGAAPARRRRGAAVRLREPTAGRFSSTSTRSSSRRRRRRPTARRASISPACALPREAFTQAPVRTLQTSSERRSC